MKKQIHLLSLLSALAMPTAWATNVDLADRPLVSGTTGDVKPNVMLVFDNSGSMGWSHMPDHVRDLRSKVGYKSSQCNSVYYNPAITYAPPLNANGTSFPNASFTNAWYNGFDTGDGTTNLSTSFRAYDNTTSWGGGDDTAQAAYYYQYTGTLPAMSYTYTAAGNVDTSTAFYKECNGSIAGKFTKVLVDAAQQTNFANWYSYYRTRVQMAKTSVGRAFTNLSEPANYRIGFTSHRYTGVNTNDGEFQKIDDFCEITAGSPPTVCTQRSKFFEKLYSQSASGGTPIRAALSKAGRIYAGKINRADDPVQYSCQQNFTILTTDGFWNGDAGYNLSGGGLGNEDGGTTPRPMLDTKGAGGTMADIAMYYYNTDLRTPALGNCTNKSGLTTNDLCENNVSGAGADSAIHQHMTTFTLGLGVDGTLTYCPDYENGACPAYQALIAGTKDWPNPNPTENLTRVDDLWHAAVNGRGKYFSAKDPATLASGIEKALSGISARVASAAAAATSTLEPVAGDNLIFNARYTTVDWDGDIQAKQILIDPSTGAVSLSPTVDWSAQAKLDLKVAPASDTRTIYFNNNGTLASFVAGNLGSYISAGVFKVDPTNPGGQLSQYPDFTAAEQTAATPQSIIEYVRGQRQYEDKPANALKIYRSRNHALGDIVNAAPKYVRKPPFAYTDANYSAFKTLRDTRQGMVYAGGNDGMLHAFDAVTGDEVWSFIPTAVIPKLYKLADKNYSTNHKFFVDGPLVISDICPSAPASDCTDSQWRTILVGGLGNGGRAYFALDVTDPSNPTMLWEFTDTNLGKTYGNPVIVKRNGQWVVLVTSGFNNVSPGDGRGYLYILNAATGAKLAEIATDTAVTDPLKSGITRISNWVDDTYVDNSSQHVYGGDMDGNVWRFDILANTVVKLTTIGKVAGAPTQPITTRPELAEIRIDGVKRRVVLVGAGQYLGTSDLNSTDMMSIYGIKDDLTTPPLGMFRSRSDVVVQDLSGTSTTRNITYSKMAPPPGKTGWYMDFDVRPGERVNVDPRYQVGWWTVPANIPDPNACNVGGTSWLYFVDPWPRNDGAAQAGSTVFVGNALIVGVGFIKVGDKVAVTVRTSDDDLKFKELPPSPPDGAVRRLFWRELAQ